MWWLFLCGMLSAVVLSFVVDGTKFPWELFDIATVLIGSVTIFSAMSIFRIELASRKVGDFRRYVASSRETLASVAKNSANLIKARAEGGFAESDQFAAVLPWFDRVHDLSSVGTEQEPLPISSQLPAFPTEVSDREISLVKDLVDKCLQSYDEKFRDYSLVLKETNASSLDADLNVFMPFLVTLISALSLFKAICLYNAN